MLGIYRTYWLNFLQPYPNSKFSIENFLKKLIRFEKSYLQICNHNYVKLVLYANTLKAVLYIPYLETLDLMVQFFTA